MIEYRGYVGVFEFDLDSFHGKVINTNDVITFYGASASKLRREMKRSIDEYLEFCHEQGRAPEKPFSGRFMVRAGADLHRRLALEAGRRRISMNTYVREVLERQVGEEVPR